MNVLRAARLTSNATLPCRKHPADAGLDLFSNEMAAIPPRAIQIVHTGITVEIPDGYVGLIKPKSRNNHLVGAGVVDAGYQGEILIKVVNPTDQTLEIQPGDGIGQLLILPVFTPAVVEVPLTEIHAQASQRGASGGILEQL